MDFDIKNTQAVDAGSTAEAETKPTTPHWQGLRRVPDKLPKVALLILVVEVSWLSLCSQMCC